MTGSLPIAPVFDVAQLEQSERSALRSVLCAPPRRRAPERLGLSLFKHARDVEPEPRAWDLGELGQWLDARARDDRPREKRDTAAWSPATFNGRGRRDEHVVDLQWLVGDFDHIQPADVETMLARLQARGFGFVCYESRRATTSDDESGPPEHGSTRVRVALALDRPVPSANWRAFRSAALRYLGVAGSADPTCANEARIYFAPCKHPDGRSAGVVLRAGSSLWVDAIREWDEDHPEPSDEPPTSAAGTTPASSASVGDAYGRGALDRAVLALVRAPRGERNTTLGREAATIGQLVGAGHLGEPAALSELRGAVAGWDASAKGQTEGTLERQFAWGLEHPRDPLPRAAASARDETAPAPDSTASPATAIDSAWRPLDVDLLMRPPPARRWLLRHPTRDDNPCAPGAGDGLFPLGKAGLFVADGGVGKTNALVALAVAIATGRRWFDHFDIDPAARRGRVLLALAEEDEEEIHRRLFNAAEAFDLDSDERRRVAEQVVALPLAGHPVALLGFGADGRTRVASPELAALRRRLDAEAGEHGWSLVVLDPLARWGDEDSEKDNAAATRLMQAAESLVTAPGNPSALVAHHASQIGVNTGKITSRGVTGIKNAARWEGSLRVDGANVWFQQTKSNYSRPMTEELRLVRGPGGMLRVPTPAEDDAYRSTVEAREGERAAEQERQRDAHQASRLAALVDRIVAVASGAPMSIRGLETAAGGMRHEDAVRAVHRAVTEGRLVAGSPLRGHDRYTLAVTGPTGPTGPIGSAGTSGPLPGRGVSALADPPGTGPVRTLSRGVGGGPDHSRRPDTGGNVELEEVHLG